MNTSLSKLICLVLRAILYFSNKAIHFSRVSNHQIVKPTKIEKHYFLGVLGNRQISLQMNLAFQQISGCFFHYSLKEHPDIFSYLNVNF